MEAQTVKRAVLDASAVMTFLYDRPGAERVTTLLERASDGHTELLMTVVNWGEVYYSVWRAEGKATAEGIVAQIARLPVNIIEVDVELTKLAAEFRALHKLPYADCFAAALARLRKAVVATADNDFRDVDGKVLILWIT